MTNNFDSLDSYGTLRTAHQFVSETLRTAILNGKLSGGTHLVQAELAKTLRVSTTPVREALRDLAGEGLVEFDPHRGAIVHELNPEELVEIFEIRKALEPLAIRKATHIISPEALEVAGSVESQMSASRDSTQWTELNGRFHYMLELQSNSKRLQNILKSAQDISSLYVAHSVSTSPKRMQRGNAQHRRMLEAVRSRDPDLAARLLVEHLQDTMDELLDTWAKDQSTA